MKTDGSPRRTDCRARIEQSNWGNALQSSRRTPASKIGEGKNRYSLDGAGQQTARRTSAGFVIANYQKNQRIIRGLCSLCGTTPVFLWQPIVLYKYDVSRHFMAGDKKYGYFQKMAGAAQAVAIYQQIESLAASHSLGDGFVFMADIAEDQDRNRYVDVNHYNGEFSATIATHILNALKDQHLLQ